MTEVNSTDASFAVFFPQAVASSCAAKDSVELNEVSAPREDRCSSGDS